MLLNLILISSLFFILIVNFRHFKWLCNVCDVLYDAYFAIAGEAGSEDSRFGVPKGCFSFKRYTM